MAQRPYQRDYQMILKIDTIDWQKWLNPPYKKGRLDSDFVWVDSLTKDKEGWDVLSHPFIDKMEGLNGIDFTVKAVFKDEGIVYQRIFAN